MKISFVIPCYRSEDTIRGVVDNIRKCALSCADDWEAILVSDNSPDRVFEVIKEMVAQDSSHLTGVELARNWGQHAALMAGYRLASGDVIASVDDDGQMPIGSIPQMLAQLKKGNDVVFGSYTKRQYNFFRNVGSRINDYMAEWLIGKPRDLKISSFFIARRYVIQRITCYQHAFPYILGLLLQTTCHMTSVPVEHQMRVSGKSGYTLRKLISLWLNGFTAFSVKPLRVASVVGVFISCISFFAIIYLLLDKIFFHPNLPAGYSSLMVGIVFFSGILMIVLGVVGEYVGRIYMCLNSSPQYVIRELIGKNAEKTACPNNINR